MRAMKWVLALAAMQLCLLGVIATVFPGCDGRAESPNFGPTITDLAARPDQIFVGGTAEITAVVDDPERAAFEWRLTLQSDSTAQGTFSPDFGDRVRLNSIFRATRVGRAVIVVTATDTQMNSTTATVTVNVGVGEGPQASGGR